MTAVSQSYPNYLGGLNEQPDELKKPGQLVEALNVIPDPVVGLSRRPGFEKINDINGITKEDAAGTWFEINLSNQINNDYIYIGCVSPQGRIKIFDQDGETQLVKYTNTAVRPHRKYTYNNNVLKVYDKNNDLEQELTDLDGSPIVKYFEHESATPLKYCVSKSNVVFANPAVIPTFSSKQKPSNTDKKRYYSFINLKVLDAENYTYVFKRFYPDDAVETYRYLTDVEVSSVAGLDNNEWDKDLTLPLNNHTERFTLNGAGIDEPAVVDVTFTGYVRTWKSKDGDGYPQEARYTWDAVLISGGKGYRDGQVYSETFNFQNKPPLVVTFRVKDSQPVTATKNDNIVPGKDSSEGISGYSLDQILSDLRQEFLDAGIDKVVRVGSGLYLENTTEFSVSTTEIAVADIMNSQKLDDDLVPIVRVNTVAELPIECYAGFIVEVVNSFDNQNNYYLKYNAESESKDDLDLTKSDGYWEEIAKPFEEVDPNNFTMPHMITVVNELETDKFAFVVSPMGYVRRSAGTQNDNPSMFADTSPVTEVNYYKNRLFFFTNAGTIISSRAGEINNLFLNTAISTSLIDPIDIIANSNQRVPIHGSSIVNNGLVLFGETEQYNLSTSNDVLTAETANVTKISNYSFDRVSTPTYVGTNLGFISKGLSRFYEMTNVYDRGPIDINERSQQVMMQFGQGFNIPVSSREQSMVLFYKKFTEEAGPSNRDMYIYRYRQENSQESSQTSWVKWRVDRQVAYATLPQDKVLLVVVNDGSVTLYKMDSGVVDGLPANADSLTRMPRFTDGWEGVNTQGAPFETRITFPTIYAQSRRGQFVSDVTSNLTIHRVKMSTAAIGAYNLEIKRKGYDTYKLLVEQTPADEYRSDPLVTIPGAADIRSYPLYGEHVETVPIYTRNYNLTLTMSTTYDAPLTLRSMTWEGDWNPPYYKRV